MLNLDERSTNGHKAYVNGAILEVSRVVQSLLGSFLLLVESEDIFLSSKRWRFIGMDKEMDKCILEKSSPKH